MIIQPNKKERDYMITYLSIGLIGNLLELFTILTGCGRNGKSNVVELLKTHKLKSNRKYIKMDKLI
jgi:hypothetical protein